MIYKTLLFAIGTATLSLTACQGQDNNLSSTLISGPGALVTTTAPATDLRVYTTDALLFVGSGTWAAEVSALKDIMNSHGMSYQAVCESELNGFTLDDLGKFGMIIFPGGSGGTEAKSLTPATHGKLRQAVQEKGMSYIGWCAGAFIAAAPAPAPGQDVSYGLGIINAPVLEYYYLSNQGVELAMTLYEFADGRKRDIIWYGGPLTPNIPGGVVAKYPNGDPAITEAFSGNGFVMISAGHPTVSESTKTSLGLSDSDGSDQDIAWEMLDATLRRKPFKAF